MWKGWGQAGSLFFLQIPIYSEDWVIQLAPLQLALGHRSSCLTTPMVCMHYSGETQKINYWASTLSLLWPPLVEIRRFWGAGILDFAPASSARVTPLASLQLPMLLTYTLFLLLSCVVRDRRRVPAGSWSWGSTLFFFSAHILDWARISEAPQVGQALG